MVRKIPFWAALLGLLCTAALMFVCLVVFGLEPQIPLLLGCGVSAIIALCCGYHWEEICSGMVKGISQSLEAILILLLIGVLMGVWIAAGVVPAMVYYGLQLITPRLFLPSAMLVCAIISMALGSWGTAGTVGLALIGMAQAMGFPLPLAAGAIISGSYVGDKLSPMADSTNLAAAVAEVSVFDNVRNMLKVALPMLVVCLGAYTLIGWHCGTQLGDSALADIRTVTAVLGQNFHIDFLSFLPLAVLLLCILLKLPAIPSIFIGVIAGVVYGALAQGVSVPALLTCAFSGYVGQTGTVLVDGLLTAGGLSSMLYSVSIVILAMAFGGVMEHTGQIAVLMAPVVRHLHSFVSLVAATVVTCVGINIVLPDQYIAIALPGRMYAAEYDRHGLPRKDLAMCIGAGGALTSALVPWNTCGIFMSGVLGVDTLHYLPYAFYNFSVPLAVIVYAAILQILRKRKENVAV